MSHQEPVNNLVTWIYDNGSFVPSAKIIEDKKYSILSDYLGRPAQAYDEKGEIVWSAEYDIYGKITKLKGDKTFVPFRQLGQYEDVETPDLYYIDLGIMMRVRGFILVKIQSESMVTTLLFMLIQKIVIVGLTFLDYFRRR